MEYDLERLLPYLYGLCDLDLKSPELIRFPRRTKSQLSAALWGNVETPCGARLRFRTQCENIIVDCKHISENDHQSMSRLGQCGMDLYADGEFIGFYVPSGQAGPYMGFLKVDPSQEHDYELYLPIRAKVQWNVLALEYEDDRLAKQYGIANPTLKPYSKPYTIPGAMVFYGSSITHGASVSRPSLTYPAILSRRLNVDFLNFGFGGTGKGEPEVVDLLANLKDVNLFVIEIGINLSSKDEFNLIYPRYDAMVQKLKTAHPKIPIILMNVQDFPMKWDYERQKYRDIFRTEIARVYQQEIDTGNKLIDYIDGQELLGTQTSTNWDLTSDHTHPNDAGFQHYTELLFPKIKRLLHLD